MPKRYWIRILDLPWQEVPEEKFFQISSLVSKDISGYGYFSTRLVDGVATTGNTLPTDALAAALSVERILGSEITCTDYDR